MDFNFLKEILFYVGSSIGVLIGLFEIIKIIEYIKIRYFNYITITCQPLSDTKNLIDIKKKYFDIELKFYNPSKETRHIKDIKIFPLPDDWTYSGDPKSFNVPFGCTLKKLKVPKGMFDKNIFKKGGEIKFCINIRNTNDKSKDIIGWISFERDGISSQEKEIKMRV